MVSESLRHLFNPESIAVIGASTTRGKVGNAILRNLILYGYKGDIYPVNPKYSEVEGLKCYFSVKDIEKPPHLAIICVPASAVLGTVEECCEKGTKAISVISAGFREIGKEGVEAEKKIAEIGRKYGVRILGPNSLGLMNAHLNMNATFVSSEPRKGNIGIISQSGAICAAVLDWADQAQIGFSKFVSIGNKADLDEADILEYFGKDEDTAVIGMYLESTDDGRKFMDVLSSVTPKKPVIILKSGKSDFGAKAATSHTGAMAGKDTVFQSAINACGAVRVKDTDGLFDALQAFSLIPVPEKGGIAIITNAGGLGVMAADAVAENSVKTASLSDETEKKLRSFLPKEASSENPIDVLGDASSERYLETLRVVAKDEDVSSAAVLLCPTDLADPEEIARGILRFGKENRFPVAAGFVGGERIGKGAAVLRSSGIPIYPSADRSIYALGLLYDYISSRDKIRKRALPASGKEGSREAAMKVIDIAICEGRRSLSEDEGRAVLEAYGIPTVTGGKAETAEEAVKLAEKLGYPVVMKISAPDIAHKTDVGGVVLNIRSSEELRKNFEIMISKIRNRLPDVRIDGVSVQSMASGREMIAGVSNDRQFGPVLTLGLGGIFTEIMKDVSVGVLPLDDEDLDNMIHSLKSYHLLIGARGKPPADVPAFKNTLHSFMTLVNELPEISEIEMNPVMVGDIGAGCVAVDALITLKGVKK